MRSGRNGAARDYLEADYRSGSPVAGLPFEPPWSLLLARAATLWNLLDQLVVAAAFLPRPPPTWGACAIPC